MKTLLARCVRSIGQRRDRAWREGLGELHFQLLLDQHLAQLGIANRYVPLGAAANSSLLFTLLRIVTVLRPARVLELGCGQTSYLLSDLASLRPFALTSLEHDPRWREIVSGGVRHEIVLAALEDKTVHGVGVAGYAWPACVAEGRWNVVVVDGPRGVRRHSRWGTLELIPDHLDREFVLVFDDAERRGERDTIAKACELLSRAARPFSEAVVRARKHQHLIFSPGYRQLWELKTD